MPAEQKQSKTLRDLQNTLPIHVKGKNDQSFTFKDWGMKEEKEISKIKAKNPPTGKFISDILCFMIVTLHGESFQQLDIKQRKLIINQMPLGNVLYLYLYLRYDQLGEEIRMTFKCPFCSENITDFVADIGDIDVDCKFGDYEDLGHYQLKKPINLEKGDVLVEKLNYGIVKWELMERAELVKANDLGAMKEMTFNHCIKDVNDGMKVIIPNVTEKMKKVDIEKLYTDITAHSGGPMVQANVECHKCNQSFWQMIDWSYEFFFGLGSLPKA